MWKARISMLNIFNPVMCRLTLWFQQILSLSLCSDIINAFLLPDCTKYHYILLITEKGERK